MVVPTVSSGDGVVRRLAGGVEEAVGGDGLGVGARRAGCEVGGDLLSGHGLFLSDGWTWPAVVDGPAGTVMSRGPWRETPVVRSCCGLPRTSDGRPAFDHDALVHEDHLVADLAGEAELVGDHHHGHPGLGQGLHDVEHLADELRVERRGRLVEEHELGLHGQRPGDGDPLLLPAGELLRVGVPAVAEPDAVQQGLGLGGDFARGAGRAHGRVLR